MRITSLYIGAFGGIRDVPMEFHAGLNGYCRENGWGKSTLLLFIKSMLYGLSDGRKQSYKENERKRALPRGGGNAFGSLSFHWEGGAYRIERSFGTKPSLDTLKIYDTQTGKPTDRFGTEPGQRMFLMSGDVFERTAFFSERELALSESRESPFLEERDSTDPVEEPTRALARLAEARKFYLRTGDRGALPEARAALSSYREQLYATEAQEHGAETASEGVLEQLLRLKRAEAEAERETLQRLFAAGTPTGQQLLSAGRALRYRCCGRTGGILGGLGLLLLLLSGLGAWLLHPAVIWGMVPAFLLLLLSYVNIHLHNRYKSAKRLLSRYPTVTSDPVGELLGALSALERVLSEQGNTPHTSVMTKEVRAGLSRVQAEHREEQRQHLRALCAEAESRVARYEERVRLLSAAEEHLRGASHRLQSQRLARVQLGLRRILSSFGSDGGELDASGQVFVCSGGLRYPSEAFSRGEGAVHALALRAGYWQALEERHRPPLLLDDPFCALDAETLQTAGQWLAALGQDGQVLYFTCHQSRAFGTEGSPT